MTIVGKILVILVFLMSLVAAGFFAIDYATRTNWKAAYEALRAEMEVADKNRGVFVGTTDNLNKEARKYRQDADDAQKNLVAAEEKWKALEANYKIQILDANSRADDADLRAVAEREATERHKKENSYLLDTIKKREAFILILEKDVQKYRTEAVANENLARAMQGRNESLLAQVQEMTRTIATLQTGKGGSDVAGAKDPNAPNPPANFVRGSITKIHAEDRTLVEISLGSDHGVNKNHTLEVYRLKPQPEYLGTIRILDARHHNSVGQLMRASATTVRQLQEGDIVATSISK